MNHHSRLCRFLALMLSLLLVLSVPLNAAAMEAETDNAITSVVEPLAFTDDRTVQLADTTVTGSVLKEALEQAGYSPNVLGVKVAYAYSAALNSAGNALANPIVVNDDTVCELETGVTYYVATKALIGNNYNGNQSSFHIVVVNASEIVVKENPSIATVPNGVISAEQVWEAVVASTTPDYLTADSVKIEYLVSTILGFETWTDLRNPAANSRAFGTNASEKVRITWDGDESYLNTQVTVDVAIEVATAVLTPVENPTLVVYQDETVTNEMIWNAVVASADPAYITAENVTVTFMAGSLLNIERWESLDYTPGLLEVSYHAFGTQETERVRITWGGDDTFAGTTLEVELHVTYVRHHNLTVNVSGADASLVSVDKTVLYEGETATIVVTELPGFSISVTANGEELAGENGVYTVTMGTANVTVNVTYTWTSVTVDEVLNGTVNVTAPDAEGLMTVTVTPDDQYGVACVVINGEVYTELTFGTRGVVTLKVPAAADGGMNTVSAVILPELDTPAAEEQPVEINYFEGYVLEGTLEEYLFESVVNEDNSLLTAEDVQINFLYTLPGLPIIGDLQIPLPLNASPNDIITYLEDTLAGLGLGSTIADTIISFVVNQGSEWLNFHAFGREYETIRITYRTTAGAQCGYNVTRDVKLHLLDTRVATELVLSAETYTMGYGDAKAVSGIKSLVTSVLAENGVLVTFTEDDLVLSTDVTALNVGEYDITLRYKGNNNYSASEVSLHLVVVKGRASIKIDSQVVKYDGNQHVPVITTTPANVKYASIIVGIDGEAMGFVSIMLDSQMKATLDRDLTIPIIGTVINPYQELLNIVNTFLNSDMDENAEDFMLNALESLQRILDALNMNVDLTGMTTVLNILVTIRRTIGRVNFYIDKYPVNSGVYLVGAATTDPNVNLALNLGFLVILPSCEAELVWNQEIENHILPYADAQTFDFGAALVKDEAPVKNANVKYLNLGVQANGRFYISFTDGGRAAGAYTELAYSLVNYVAAKGRTYVVTRDCAEIRFLATDEAGNTVLADYMETGYTYDGQPHGVDAVLVDKDGNVIEGHTPVVTYIGLSAGLKGYLSTQRPTNVGAYLCVASLAGDPEYRMVVSANARMTIEPKCGSLKLGEITTVYGEPVDLSQISYTAENLTDEEVAAILATLTCAGPDVVGTHAVKASVPASLCGNSVITVCEGKHTVTPREIHVTIEDKTKGYGEADPEFTYVVDEGSVIDGDDLGLVLSRVPGEEPGTYEIHVSSESQINPNYIVHVGFGTLTIEEPAEPDLGSIVVKADDIARCVYAPDPELTWSLVSGEIPEGLDLQITLTREPGEALGEYVISGVSALENVTVLDGTFTITLCDACEFCPSKQFEDLDTDQWYHTATDFVLEHGIMHGFDTGDFLPYGTLTRAQWALMMYQMAGKPACEAANPYADVVEGAWYYDAVVWANATGVIIGYTDGNYGVNDYLTREQMITILYRYADKPATTITENTFADADTISFWAADAMLWAEEIHLINGSGDNLCRAIEPCSRVEAAQVLMNYILRVLG